MTRQCNKKKVLLVAYCFPPLGGVGTLRTLTLIKHLEEFGWSAQVLTVREGAGGQPEDRELMQSVPKSFRITRTGCWDLAALQRIPPESISARITARISAKLLPDPYVGWVPFAYYAGLKLVEHNKIDVIYTADLYSAHLVGYLLSKATGKPWVADIGDEWASHPFRSRVFPGQKSAERWLERKVLGAASQVVIAWPELRSLLALDDKKKCTVITCGFSAEDFSLPAAEATTPEGRFRITYTGSFYASQQPTGLLHAVQTLFDSGQVSSDSIELMFVGRTRRAGMQQFAGTAVARSIVYAGFVTHRQAISYLRNTGALLLVVSTERGSGNVPGKTFEYLASGKPILALVPPDGATADLIRATNTGIVVAPDDVGAIRAAFLSLYTQWKEGRLRTEPNWAKIFEYEARNLGRSLSYVLDRASPS